MRMWSMVFFLAVVLLTQKSFAATEKDYRILIENYIQAIASSDDGAILSAWREINKMPDAQIFMETQFPLAAYSFRMTGMAIKLADDLKQFQEAYPNVPVSFDTTVGYVPLKGSQDLTNNKATSVLPNQEQPLQQAQVERDRKNPPITNQVTASNALNNDQRSNQVQINDDLNRMGLGN